MGKLVCATAILQCSEGVSPCPLTVVTNQTVLIAGRPAATVNDISPASIPTFGMCCSLANPEVAAATTAAQGVLTPQPCVPVIAGPWLTGSPSVMLQKQVALNNSSKAMCAYAGEISINFPGQEQVSIP